MIEAGLIPADVVHEDDEKGASSMARKNKKTKKKNPAQNTENTTEAEVDTPATAENLVVNQEEPIAKKPTQITQE